MSKARPTTNSHLPTTAPKPLVVIVGETASGKSKLAMDIAQSINRAAAYRLESVSVRSRESQANRTRGTVGRDSQGGKPKMAKKSAESPATLSSRLAGLEGAEIIGADSRLVYKGMDIGTAKPSKHEQSEVKHHMIDLVEPDEKFTVADYKHLALSAIADIRNRGKLPIIVGGTGLYVDAVVFDYQFRSRYDDKIRVSLEAMTLAQLQRLAYGAGFETQAGQKNRRQLIRLLESGQNSNVDRNQMIDNVIIVGLQINRSHLRKNIENRVEQMFRRGLRKEVDELVKRYGWEHEALTGIGYREFEQYYLKELSASALKRQIVQHTINYAKRQRTWFKRNPHIKWFEDAQTALDYVMLQLADSGG